MTMCGEAEWQEEAFTVTAGPEAAGIRLDVFCHSILRPESQAEIMRRS